MEFGKLEGKLAVVTGGCGALGRAICKALLADGLRVAVADLERAKPEEAAASLGRGAMPMPLDVADPAAVAAAVAALRKAQGDVDVLVNNAGILSNNKTVQTEPEEWRRVMGVNLDGAFYLSRAVLPGMRARRWGRIVNICSLAMKSGGITAGTAYTASKGGLSALTFSIAREVAGDGITVNGIAPAYIKTPMVTEQLSEAQRQALLKQIPVGRFLEPEEVANVARFLVSPLSGFITGEIIDVNGGLHFD
ncbi:MAG: SDR family oxidoreductase [Alphaproteobacteria bacterium]|nr:SDR family oxidoreductase [Alphaproteobacteria bacterium]